MNRPKHYYIASLKVGGAVVFSLPADTKRQALALARRQALSFPDHVATEIDIQKYFYETAPMENQK